MEGLRRAGALLGAAVRDGGLILELRSESCPTESIQPLERPSQLDG